MKTRLLIGPVLIAMVALAMWLDWMLMGAGDGGLTQAVAEADLARRPWGFLVLAAVFLGVCAREVMGILDKCNMPADRVSVAVTGSAVLAYLVMSGPVLWHLSLPPMSMAGAVGAPLLAGAAFALVIVTARNIWNKDVSRFPGTLAGTLVTFMYVVVPGAMLVAMRMMVRPGTTDMFGWRIEDPHLGLWLIIWLVVVVRLGADSCAYFVGKAIGRHKLIPQVSPGKTVEGFVGGLAGAAILGWVAYLLMPGLEAVFTLPEIITLGAAMGLVAPIGDLTASALKRGAGVKDSGKLIPEFGGSLDLIDGFLVVGPALFLVLLWKSAASTVW